MLSNATHDRLAAKCHCSVRAQACSAHTARVAASLSYVKRLSFQFYLHETELYLQSVFSVSGGFSDGSIWL